MTIRLTSVDAFEKVLDKLKQCWGYNEETNAPFFKYCVEDIKKGVAAGDDEYYLDIDWLPDSITCRVIMVIRYHKRSETMTDEEYLNQQAKE